MTDPILAGLTARLPEAQLHQDGDVVRGTIRTGDGWFATRLRSAPFAELFVQTRKLDGFELEVRWGDRLWDPDVGDETFDEAFGLRTNDRELLRVWLDEPARRALLQSVYAYKDSLAESIPFLEELARPHMRTAIRPVEPNAMRTWTYALRDDELVATKGTSEPEAERFAIALQTATTIAARSQRWAAEYAELARSLDATARSEIELGGEPLLVAPRHGVDVELALLRRHDPHDPGGLRTRIAAARAGGGGEDTLSLVDTALPKALRPPLPDGDRRACSLPDYALHATTADPSPRLDGEATRLVALAAPSAIVVDAARVEVWFAGAPQDRTRLDAAFELAARWAVDRGGETWPYR